MGWTEAASSGALIAVITGGSVLVYLAANPWVYDEDLAWGVALAVGALFALLGVMERPTWGRVTASFLLILAADLNRLTTGWACVTAALLVAAWFALGKGGATNRRWALPMIIAGLIPLFVGCAVNWVKFGGPFTLPVADQVWTMVNAHRRYFLAVNGGDFSFRFLPSTFVAYMQPAALRFSTLFPFITLPDTPARALGGTVFDQTYATSSIPASMPLLFILSIWGAISAFRPHAVGSIRLTRLLLIAAATASGGVLLAGYIADRYLADFLPFLVLASAIALVDLFRRAAKRSRRLRVLLLVSIVVTGAFCVAANIGASLESLNIWTSAQAIRFVEAQRSLSLEPLASTVARGPVLPYWAPTGQIFDVNDCGGLYLSSGVDYHTSPGQNLQHLTWTPMEQAGGINHAITMTLTQPAGELRSVIPILRHGRTTVLLEPSGAQTLQVAVIHAGNAPSWPPSVSPPFVVQPHRLITIMVMTDPYMHSIEVRYQQVQGGFEGLATHKPAVGAGILLVDHYLAGPGPAVVVGQRRPSRSEPISISSIRTPSNMSLCKSFRSSGR